MLEFSQTEIISESRKYDTCVTWDPQAGEVTATTYVLIKEIAHKR